MSLSIITKGDHIGGVFFDYVDLYFNVKSTGYECYLYIVVKNTIDNILNFTKNIMKSYDIAYSQELLRHVYYINDENEYDEVWRNIKRTEYLVVVPSVIVDKKINHCIFDYYDKIISYINLKSFLYLKDGNLELFDVYNHSNMHYLITPFVSDRLKNFACNKYIYYVKLSKYRLDNAKLSYNNSVYNNTLYETDKYMPNFNIHDYGSLIYTRRNYFDADYYVEIKGKSIFEFLYYEKPVFYNAKPKTIDDGLTDYIRYFGIDDNITQELKIPKDVIYEKLICFDDNDLVMKLLCE